MRKAGNTTYRFGDHHPHHPEALHHPYMLTYLLRSLSPFEKGYKWLTSQLHPPPSAVMGRHPEVSIVSDQFSRGTRVRSWVIEPKFDGGQDFRVDVSRCARPGTYSSGASIVLEFGRCGAGAK